MPAHDQVSSSGKNSSFGLVNTDEIHRWFFTAKYDTWPVHLRENRFVNVASTEWYRSVLGALTVCAFTNAAPLYAAV